MKRVLCAVVASVLSAAAAAAAVPGGIGKRDVP